MICQYCAVDHPPTVGCVEALRKRIPAALTVTEIDRLYQLLDMADISNALANQPRVGQLIDEMRDILKGSKP